MDLDEDINLVNEAANIARRQSPLVQISKELTARRKHIVVLSAFVCFLLLVRTTFSSRKGNNGSENLLSNLKVKDEDILSNIDELLESRDSSTYVVNCSKAALDALEPNSKELRLREADCGAGFNLDHKRGEDEPNVRIVLFGDTFKDNFALSGCPIGAGRCPFNPRCIISLTTSLQHEALNLADVVVVTTMEAGQILKAAARSSKPKVRKVLYWREPYWTATPIDKQWDNFDFEMGVHFTSGIMNPNYLRRPVTLIAKSFFEYLPFKERNQFALSIISNCEANSQRLAYIQHLSDYLGAEKVHQYGECGNRKLPPPPMKNAAKVIAQYKFFFSFENSIQDGYVSEKLFTVLNMQLLPVYLGAANVPNITTVPCFIKAQDFRTPKQLAQYLLHLDENPEAYGQYHLWRTDPTLFSDDYLELIKYKFPSQQEVKAYGKKKGSLRTASCCRLCNLDYVDQQASRRRRTDLIPSVMTYDQINKKLFHGKVNQRPGPDARLTTSRAPDTEDNENP